MRNLIGFILASTLAASSNADSSTASWQTVSIPGVCTFKIPPTLEIQGGNYKRVTQQLKETLLEIKASANEVIAQPKGINDADPDALKRYCRIIVETECTSNGENESLHERLQLSPTDLKEIDEAIKSTVTEAAAAASARGMKAEIVSWEPVTVNLVNDVDMLVTTYTRSGAAAKSPVWVRQYMIQNNDCTHKVTISYRTSEKELWADDLLKVIETFKFEERKGNSASVK